MAHVKMKFGGISHEVEENRVSLLEAEGWTRAEDEKTEETKEKTKEKTKEPKAKKDDAE